jgi:hypothetical protein
MRSPTLIARAATLIAALTALTALALLAALTPAPATAQLPSDSSLAPGTRVRLFLGGDSRDERDARRPVLYVGTLVGATEHSIVLRPDRSRDTVELSRDSISRAQTSLGRRTHQTAVKGLAIGAVAGIVIGFAAGEDCSNNDFICFSRGETVPLGGLLGGALGGLVGALVGSRERWTDEPRLTLTPLPSGGLAMRIALEL